VSDHVFGRITVLQRWTAVTTTTTTAAAIGLLWTGIQTDIHALMGIQHMTMFPAMFVVMLLRRHEYTGR